MLSVSSTIGFTLSGLKWVSVCMGVYLPESETRTEMENTGCLLCQAKLWSEKLRKKPTHIYASLALLVLLYFKGLSLFWPNCRKTRWLHYSFLWQVLSLTNRLNSGFLKLHLLKKSVSTASTITLRRCGFGMFMVMCIVSFPPDMFSRHCNCHPSHVVYEETPEADLTAYWFWLCAVVILHRLGAEMCLFYI